VQDKLDAMTAVNRRLNLELENERQQRIAAERDYKALRQALVQLEAKFRVAASEGLSGEPSEKIEGNAFENAADTVAALLRMIMGGGG
jgi:hypothetical protein